MSAADYMVGRRIYNGASNAPNRGTSDPMGYINRGLGMSPVGGDGLSDKRSGLAQAALDRLRGGGMGAGQEQQPMQPPQQEAAPYAPNQLGFTVSPTGRLIPNSGTPLDDTVNSMYGAPPGQQGPSEVQLMEAARNRLTHHFQTKEMITKHQLNMEKLAIQAAEMINRHKDSHTKRKQGNNAMG